MIQKQTFTYEVLVRLGPDGFHGAHVIELERLVEDGAVLGERQLEARPITEARVGTIIGAENARLIEQVEGTKAEAAAMKQAVAETNAARDEALAAKDAETAATLAEREVEITARDQVIAERDAQVEALQARIAELTPAEPSTSVVSRRQMKLALHGAGILDDIETFVAAADRVVQISWTEATEFHRTDTLLNHMAAAFGMSDADLDALFAAASGL